ncbi:hypothetical protein F5X68DRAFT_233981 [Plectosphaerella plurivora]|uniref:Uncharacterized protein n=1 Tax=Plectosphaerella plurivora TaxID=936078 RepID=A0A9P8V7B3_9PEZI|nr:hypothetical protein F5X68DRAFT_233981 [Plectosphaerella plurivora]
MSLTVKPLDHPSFFLLTFEPLQPTTTSNAMATPKLPPLKPFRVLLDPRVNDTARGPNLPAPGIASLLDLPEIDLVILTHSSRDTIHEPTIRDLPGRNSALRTPPLVLAEHRVAGLVRGWDHFPKDRIRTIPVWRDPGLTSRDGVSRVQVPPFIPGGHTGELTVALVPFAKTDTTRTGRAAAVGITYRPPPPGTAPRSPGARGTGAALSVLFCPRGASYISMAAFATGHLVAEAALPLTCLLHPFDEVTAPWWCPWGALRRTGAPEGCETAAALGARGWLWGQSIPAAKGALKRRLVKTRKWKKREVVQALYGVVQGKGKGRKTTVFRMGIGDEVVLTQEEARGVPRKASVKAASGEGESGKEVSGEGESSAKAVSVVHTVGEAHGTDQPDGAEGNGN